MHNNFTIVLIRPTYDPEIQLLTFAGTKLIDEINSKHKPKVIDINDHEIDRVYVEQLLSNIESETILLYFGHDGNDGSGKGFRGGETHYVLDTDNVNYMRDKVVFANTCHCYKNHGIASKDSGVRIYMGYDNYLWVFSDGEEIEGFHETINCPFRVFYFDSIRDIEKIKKRTLKEYRKWVKYWYKKDTVISKVKAAFLDMNSVAFNILKN